MPTYRGISSEAFQHPLDHQAEEALRNLPGFEFVARKFVEFVYERPQLIYQMGNHIQVGPRQYSSIYQIFRECIRDLDIDPEPILFISQDPQANSYALGQENPYIVLNTGVLDLLNEDEIRTVLAHELGHIKCGHTILIQMAIWAMGAATTVGQLTFGLGSIVSQGLIYAFFEWRRKAELSADRAALLVMDDLDVVMSTMMKISGGSHKYLNECSLQEFIRQSEKYQSLDEDGLNQIYKFLLYNGGQGMMLSHPFAVERIKYLQDWALSDEYKQIKQGKYKQKNETGSVNVKVENEADEAEQLRKKIEELQQEINKMRNSE